MDLVFDHVSKFYGAVQGINDFHCRIGPGVTALLGSNGAGKSTLLKLATGQLRPTLGKVRIGAYSARSAKSKRHIGYSPDSSRFYEEMTGMEFVWAMARLQGQSRSSAREQAAAALDSVGMASRAHRAIKGYSRGMRQRIKIAQALVHQPEVLILDEPFDGIDPAGRRALSSLLDELGESGRTVVLSSHLLHDVQAIAAKMVVIARGRLVASGALAEIRDLLEDQPRTVQVEVDSPRGLAADLVQSPEVQQVRVEEGRLIVRTSQSPEFFARLQRVIAESGVVVHRLETLDSDAESVFHYLHQES